MRAIVPVAGQGKRLWPHTHTVPKVLLHVAGKPMLGHILDELIAVKIERVTFVVGTMGEMVKEYVSKAYCGLQAAYVRQEKLDGLGHAIWLARPTVDDLSEPLLIILGDTLFRADLPTVLNAPVSMIAVKEVDNPQRFGIVELSGDRITNMVEKPKKPPTNLAIVGIYYLRNPKLLFDCLDEIVAADERTDGEIQLTNALRRMVHRGEIIKPFFVDDWYDCGKPETLLATNRALLQAKYRNSAHADAARFPGSIINAPVYIAPNAKVENSIVGPYVTVAEESVIRNSIVSNSIISSCALVQNMILTESIVSDRAKIFGEAYRLNVGDSSEISFGTITTRNRT
ncbi:MAG: sugar phosphate nucleotidyltransferase [Candidatus Sumerlaeia bacterium]|nr:sugar phosphate nucleotidyltransferase [Candidatus Sumerlaeia bacterium]